MNAVRIIAINLIVFVFGLILTTQSAFAQADDYQSNLDNYRSQYALYQIKKNEFNQFGTYTAEEELIKSAKSMLLARADVWLSYWDMYLRLTSQTPTLEPPAREAMNNFYRSEIDWLKKHKEDLLTKDRRDSLMIEVEKLNEKGVLYEAASSQSIALVYNARIRGIVERLLILNRGADERTKSQTIAAETKALKLRGL